MSSGPFDYGARVAAAQRAMEIRSLDVLLLSVGSDLPYLTGYRAMASERLTMLVVPREGEATLVVPELEAPRVEAEGRFGVRPWRETDDPVAVVADLVGSAVSAGIGDQTWSTFLLRLQQRLPALRFVSATPVMAELRVVKDAAELDRLRRAAAVVDRVADLLMDERFAGRTERDLSHRIRAMTVAEGSDTATFAIVASGPNGASPHHEPGDRIIEAGDGVVVDFGGTVDGYCSDTTRTFHVGPPSPEYAAAFAALGQAQEAGCAAVRPGVAAQDVDRVTRTVLVDAGYGDFFIHRTGHGIGLDGHEDPYLVQGNGTSLRPGMVFSVEPGIYVPGRFGMRIEDIVAATVDGHERLNRSDRSLRIVE